MKVKIKRERKNERLEKNKTKQLVMEEEGENVDIIPSSNVEENHQIEMSQAREKCSKHAELYELDSAY